MLGIAKALQHLHAHDIVHGDVQWVSVFLSNVPEHPANHHITQPNIVINGDDVLMWNFGFYRQCYHETSEIWTFDYRGYHFTHRGPSKEQDIFSCALIFLSLGLAALRGDGCQDAADGMAKFYEISPALKTSASKRTPRPAMPTMLAQANCFGGEKGELVWKLISEMTDPEAAASLSMDIVVQRLSAIAFAD
jgi:hypothetical protein